MGISDNTYISPDLVIDMDFGIQTDVCSIFNLFVFVSVSSRLLNLFVSISVSITKSAFPYPCRSLVYFIKNYLLKMNLKIFLMSIIYNNFNI